MSRHSDMNNCFLSSRHFLLISFMSIICILSVMMYPSIQLLFLFLFCFWSQSRSNPKTCEVALHGTQGHVQVSQCYSFFVSLFSKCLECGMSCGNLEIIFKSRVLLLLVYLTQSQTIQEERTSVEKMPTSDCGQAGGAFSQLLIDIGGTIPWVGGSTTLVKLVLRWYKKQAEQPIVASQ